MTTDQMRFLAAILIFILIFLPFSVQAARGSLSTLSNTLKEVEKDTLVIIATLALFIFVVITYLLIGSTDGKWAEDLLKVIVGILAGMGAAKATSSIEQKIEHGNNNIQAMGDVIEKLEGDIHKIEQAIFASSKSQSKDKIIVLSDTVTLKLNHENPMPTNDSPSRVAESSVTSNSFSVKTMTDALRGNVESEKNTLQNLSTLPIDTLRTQKYFERCLHEFDFIKQIRQAHSELCNDNWDVKNITFDQSLNGVVVMFRVEKKLSLYDLD